MPHDDNNRHKGDSFLSSNIGQMLQPFFPSLHTPISIEEKIAATLHSEIFELDSAILRRKRSAFRTPNLWKGGIFLKEGSTCFTTELGFSRNTLEFSSLTIINQPLQELWNRPWFRFDNPNLITLPSGGMVNSNPKYLGLGLVPPNLRVQAGLVPINQGNCWTLRMPLRNAIELQYLQRMLKPRIRSSKSRRCMIFSMVSEGAVCQHPSTTSHSHANQPQSQNKKTNFPKMTVSKFQKNE